MSPEMVCGRWYDEKTDVWSLEALCGFKGSRHLFRLLLLAPEWSKNDRLGRGTVPKYQPVASQGDPFRIFVDDCPNMF